MRLFKYLHPDRVDVLRDKLLCFSSPANLNDPFEMRPPMKLFDSINSLREAMSKPFESAIEEQLASLGPLRHFISAEQVEQLRAKVWESLPKVLDRHAPEFQKSLNQALEKAVGMLCLSEQQNDILMWAHYANSHEGFVIEFDPTSEFFDGRRTDKDEFRYLRKVVYADARPQLVMNKAEDMSAFLTKSQHWAYEKEWRMMFALGDATEVKVFGEKQFHLFSFPTSAILSVTFGCRMSQLKRDEITEVLQSDRHLAGIDIYEASPDQDLFQLNIFPVKS